MIICCNDIEFSVFMSFDFYFFVEDLVNIFFEDCIGFGACGAEPNTINSKLTFSYFPGQFLRCYFCCLNSSNIFKS